MRAYYRQSVGKQLLCPLFVFICTNIEMIHFLQYAILGYCLMSIYPDSLLCFIIVSFLGISDEFFNYIWHPQFTPYLDFNDMILNSVGTLMGIIAYLTVHRIAPKKLNYRIVITSHVFALPILTILMAGITFGFIKLHYQRPTPIGSVFIDKAFVLSFKQPQKFWETTPTGRKFHIMDPVEGILALSLFLSANGYLLQTIKTAKEGS